MIIRMRIFIQLNNFEKSKPLIKERVYRLFTFFDLWYIVKPLPSRNAHKDFYANSTIIKLMNEYKKFVKYFSISFLVLPRI